VKCDGFASKRQQQHAKKEMAARSKENRFG